MKVIKCDRCGAFETHGETLTGTVPCGAFGRVTSRYPDMLDLCWGCAKELRGILADWFKEGGGKMEPLQELDTFGNKGE